MAPIAAIRVGGADRLWDGCHDFTSLAPWIARRPPVPVEGPRCDEIGVFATLIARFGLGLIPPVEDGLRDRGEGPLLDLVHNLETTGWTGRARNESVLWAIQDL